LQRWRSSIHAVLSPRPRAVVLAPGGVEERGFAGKNILADQLNLVGEASVVVDAGAYDGSVAAEYLEIFPAATCHALEPHPSSFRSLTDRLDGHPRARLHELAIADRPGRRLLHSFATAATNSLLAPIPWVHKVVGANHMDEFTQVEIEVTTLDRFAEQEGLSRIDVLKLDVQGAEVLALEGAERLLRAHAIGLVATEVDFVQVYREQAFYHDVAATLQRVGYRLYDFYNFHYGPGGQLQWGDAIFLPETTTSRRRA
jgi:FkbM family methyltransferase